MDENHENISADKISSESYEINSVTSSNSGTANLKHQSDIEAKLSHYESECHRFGLAKIKMIQRCIREEDVCQLDDYGMSTMQCQVVFDIFGMRPTTPLTSISLTRNRIEHFCCHSIASFVQMSESLTKLTLEGCNFGDEGARILCEGISISTSIRRLNLANCSISDVGGEAVARSFLVNDVCQELDLSCNKLSLRSATAFGEVLGENKSLTKLDLSRNMLYEDDAIVNLLKGLSRNETLEVLDVSWNALGGEAFGKILLKSIKSSHLKQLKLEHNRMSTFELKKLAIGLRRSATIEAVYIADNAIMGADDVSLINVFRSNSPLELLSFGRCFHLSQDAFRLLREIEAHKPHVKVIYQSVMLPNPPREVVMLDLYADRAGFIAKSPKAKMLQRDLSEFMKQLKDLEDAYLPKSDFYKLLKRFKAKYHEDLMEHYIDACSVNVVGQKQLDVHLMANHYLNRHPVK